MSSVSPDIILNVVKRNNAYLQRRRPNSGQPTFSVEKGNLTFKPTLKHSGLAQNRTVSLGIKAKTGNKRCHIVIGRKEDANKPRSAYKKIIVKRHGFNKKAQNVIQQAASVRPELAFPAAKRFAALYKADVAKQHQKSKQQE